MAVKRYFHEIWIFLVNFQVKKTCLISQILFEIMDPKAIEALKKYRAMVFGAIESLVPAGVPKETVIEAVSFCYKIIRNKN